MTRANRPGPRPSNLLLAALLAVMMAATGTPAERVVLGEYFTNLY